VATEANKPEDAEKPEALPVETPAAEPEVIVAAASADDCPKCDDCPDCPPVGAPAWMATFADMATLLMAFFVLILSFAEMNVPKFKQINGSLKNSFGVQRIVPVVESPKGTSIIARNFSPAITEPTPIENVTQQTTDERKPEPVIKTDDSSGTKGPQEAATEVRKSLANEIASGKVEVTTEEGKVVVYVNKPPSGAGDGQSGTQQGGPAASTVAQGGSSASAQTGAPGTGAQSGGMAQGSNAGGMSQAAQTGGAASGQVAGGSAAKGAQQGGAVPQETIDLYAKIAEAQAATTAKVEVRDSQSANTQNAQSGGGIGNANKAQTDSQYARIRKDLAKEIEAGKAEVERDGARIIIRLAEQGSFASGSATLQRGFAETLNSVGKSIAQSTGRIYIEGHTDNVPVVFNDRFQSNWDLSGARSGAVADYLTARAGLQQGRVSVSGYADTRPIDTNDTPAGRAKNRRIEVIIDGGK
jgi:chemotaxis protein MotB